MTKEEIKKAALDDIKKLCEIKETIDKEVDKLCNVFPGSFQSPLIDSFYKVFDHCLFLLSKHYEISLIALEWFFYDNDMGENKLEVEGKIISNVDDFVDFEIVHGGCEEDK